MTFIENLKKKLSVSLRNKIRYRLPSVIFRKKSYSQCGEDLLICFLMNLIKGTNKITYLDIGANHPFQLSNTALLYRNGARGALVEPDPYFVNLIRKKRPEDEVLQYGVHFSGEQSAAFYIMDSPTLNTFSKLEMQRYVEMGHSLIKIININLIGINELLERYEDLDFLNLDIEGLDFAVLKLIDWKKYRPKCLCLETLKYEKEKEPLKQNEIIDFMKQQNYFVYADTYINTIFVDNEAWSLRWSSKA